MNRLRPPRRHYRLPHLPRPSASADISPSCSAISSVRPHLRGARCRRLARSGRPYLDAASAAVTEMGGHVAKKFGDGLMALFGFPVAHENDAERAARAALSIQRAFADVNRKNAGRPGQRSTPVSALK